MHHQVSQLMRESEPHSVCRLVLIQYYQRRQPRRGKGDAAYRSPPEIGMRNDDPGPLNPIGEVLHRSTWHFPVGTEEIGNSLGVAVVVNIQAGQIVRVCEFNSL